MNYVSFLMKFLSTIRTAGLNVQVKHLNVVYLQFILQRLLCNYFNIEIIHKSFVFVRVVLFFVLVKRGYIYICSLKFYYCTIGSTLCSLRNNHY